MNNDKHEDKYGVCGIKAYGKWKCFQSKEKYFAYLIEWIASTDGAERERAVDALCNLESGIMYTDTDEGV